MMTTRRVEHALLAAIVLALHALLLWAWPRTEPSRRGSVADAVVLAAPITILQPPRPAAQEPAPPTVEPPRAAARARRESAPPPTNEAAATAAPPLPDVVPPTAAAAASQPLDLRLRLSPEMARRGGLTEPAGSMRAQALNDPRSNDAADPRQQLPNAVAASAKGECLKAEYAGAGMGLLSIPFLAYHVAAGNCKPSR